MGRRSVAQHDLSFDPASEWAIDALDPATEAQLGVYAKSLEHGVFMNVRSQGAGEHPLTQEGMTNGRAVANLAGPGERGAIAAVRPAIQRLARTLRFE